MSEAEKKWMPNTMIRLCQFGDQFCDHYEICDSIRKANEGVVGCNKYLHENGYENHEDLRRFEVQVTASMDCVVYKDKI